MFMLIPHIVRAQDVFDSNTRAIDVGTANSIYVASHGTAAHGSATQPGACAVGTTGRRCCLLSRAATRPGRAAHW